MSSAASPATGALRRLVAIAARRLERPELLAAVYPPARQAQHEEIGINAALAAACAPTRPTSTSAPTAARCCARRCASRRAAATSRSSRSRRLAAELSRELSRRRLPPPRHRRAARGDRVLPLPRLDGWSGLRRSPEISDERGAPEFIDGAGLDARRGARRGHADGRQDRRRGRRAGRPRRRPRAARPRAPAGDLRARRPGGRDSTRRRSGDVVGSARRARLCRLLGHRRRSLRPLGTSPAGAVVNWLAAPLGAPAGAAGASGETGSPQPSRS